MKWRVGVKLAAVFGTFLVLLLALALVESFGDEKIEAATERLYAQGVEGTLALGEAQAALRAIRALSYHHAAAVDRGRFDALEETIEVHAERVASALDDYRRVTPAGSPRLDLVAKVRRSFERYVESTKQIYPVSRALDVKATLAELAETSGPIFDETVNGLGELLEHHLALNEETYNSAQDTLHETTRLALWLSVLAALLAIVLAWLVSQSISSRLRDVAEVADRVTRGEYAARASVRGTDEIAEVASSLNTLTAALAEKIEEEQRAVQRQTREREKLAETVEQYGAFVGRVARGELSAELPPSGDGQLRELGVNLAAMGEALRDMTLRIHDAVGALSSASAQISTTVQEHSTSATESASAVAETAATVDEVHQSAQQATEQAQHVAEVSRKSVEVSEAGRQAVEHTVTTMNDVKQRVDGIAERILSLSQQSQAVGQIITSVNELAEQSNLLALNAAIEAARAGEAGRGFAVVAQEIRALADQSREATSHVRTMLGDIQKSTTEAVLATEEGSRAVTRAVDAVRGAGDRIDQLGSSIDEASRAADHILTATQQQAQGVNQISEAMHSIDEASRQTVQGTRSIEQAAHDLHQLAGELRDAVAQYRA